MFLAAVLGAASSAAFSPVSAAGAAETVAARPLAPPGEAGTASFPTATGVRIGGDDKQTRFVMDFDRKVDLAAFTLANPYRVVIDLPQVIFHLPQDAGEKGRGLVKGFRYG